MSGRTRLLGSAALALVVLWIGVLWAGAAPATSVVGDGTPSSCDNNALGAALAEGGTVLFNCGPADHTILADTYVIDKDVVVEGGGRITLDGEDLRQIFLVNEGVSLTLNNLVLTRGYTFGPGGGAIANQGILILDGSTIRESHAAGDTGQGHGAGGAILNLGGTVTLNSSRILNNWADLRGGGLANRPGSSNQIGQLTIAGSTVQGNQAGEYGGGIDNSGRATLRSSRVLSNTAQSSFGGGLVVWDGPVEMENSLIAYNVSQMDLGGGLAIIDGTVQGRNVQILHNLATWGGAGVYTNPNRQASLLLQDSLVEGNANTAQDPPTSSINVFGGGISSGRELILERVTVRNNRAASGGGIFHYQNTGSLTVRQSTVSGNVATHVGGGFWLNGSSHLLENVTVSGNEAAGYGGGILSDGSTTLTNVTLADNEAQDGDNLYNRGSVSVANTVFADPAGVGVNCNGSAGPNLTSGGHNVASDASCGLTGANDRQSVAPGLGPLADNGGATQSHLPLAGSPAIDGGAACPNLDQRGYVRPAGSACDVGSVEVGALPATATPTATPTQTATATPSPTPTEISAEATPVPDYVPAAIDGGLQPTVNVAPNRGPAGTQVTVTGSVPGSAPGVRLLWVVENTTFLAGQTGREADGTYSEQVEVPVLLDVGPAQLCAAPLETDRAILGCADFTVEAGAFGEIVGRLPAEALPDPPVGGSRQLGFASFLLQDRAGSLLTSVPIASNGTFSLQNVQPGIYNYSVAGLLKEAVAGGSVTIVPSQRIDLEMKLYSALFVDPVTGKECRNRSWKVGSIRALYSDTGVFYRPAGAAESGQLLPRPDIASLINATVLAGREDFGTFVSGFRLDNRFSVRLQELGETAALQRVEYHVKLADGTTRFLGQSVTGPDFPVNYDVGQLPPGRHYLYAAPVVGGVRSCPESKAVTVIPSPIRISRPAAAGLPDAAQLTAAEADALLQQVCRHSFDRARLLYSFSCLIPAAGSGLPVGWPNSGPLPILGNIQSEANASLTLAGTISLAGGLQVNVFEPWLFARLFGDVVCDRRVNFGGRNMVVNPLQPQQAQLRIPYTQFCRPQFRRNYSVPLWSFLDGKVLLRGGAFLNVDGDISFGANVRPFAPSVVMALDVDANPSLGVSLSLDFWIAEAGMTPAIDSYNYLTARVNSNLNPPFDIDACLKAYLFIKVWGRVGVWKLKSDPFDIAKISVANFERCLNLPRSELEARLAAGPAEEVPPPRVMASPDLATAPDGRMLSVLVEDTDPAGDFPAPQVQARFWDPTTEQWGPPMPISGSNRPVNNPVATFYGGDGAALVAWTQTDMSLAEEEAVGGDLDALLARQEIYYARWDGQKWGAPVRLTTDQVADGRPAIAGDATGATLAWTRVIDDPDRAIMAVAVAEWEAQAGAFGTMELLSGNAQGAVAAAAAEQSAVSGLNGQVSLDRRYYPGLDASYTAVAWTHDADGNLSSDEDRGLRVGQRVVDQISLNPQPLPPKDWVLLNPQPLPPKIALPSVALDTVSPDALRLAFLANPLDTVTEGTPGAFPQVWTADLRNQGVAWTALSAPVRDELGAPVLGERPQILAAPQGENLVTFRRFGEAGTPGELGQLAASRGIIVVGGRTDYSAPAYLTGDATAQHWQATSALNPLNNSLQFLSVRRAVTGARQADQQVGVAGTTAPTVLAGTTGDPVISLGLADTGDPGLESLELDRIHAPVGKTVQVTARGRNLGRAAGRVTVIFYQGQPGSGTQIGSVDVGEVTFNQPFSATVSLEREGGLQPVYGVVVAETGGNGRTDNDLAAADLGALPAPEVNGVAASGLADRAMEVGILPSPAEAVAGYRILHSTALSGTYELAGETSELTFLDVERAVGATHCYRVQAYDAQGVVSPPSPGVCEVLPLARQFLPVIQRR